MKKLFFTLIFALGTFMVGVSSSSAYVLKPLTPFEKLQQLSAEFNHAKKPLSIDESSRLLEQGLRVLSSNSFDKEYQDVRGNAFDKEDWSKADKITASLSPLFTVTFDGDDDVHHINGYALFDATQNVSRELKQKCRHDMYCNLTEEDGSG